MATVIAPATGLPIDVPDAESVETTPVVVLNTEDNYTDPTAYWATNPLAPPVHGYDEVGVYIVHYEGFTDQCQDTEEYRNDPDAVFQDVWHDHRRRMGDQKPINYGIVGSEEYPIAYSVFRK